MYSTHNEEVSVGAKRFTITLKNKSYKHMTAAPKNVYIDKIDERVDKYHNTYHITFRLKPANIKPGRYTEHGFKHNNKNSKLKVSDHVRILKHHCFSFFFFFFFFLRKTTYQVGLRESL